MAGGRPPLGTVIEIDGAHQIFDGKNFVPAAQGGDGGWAVDQQAQSRMGIGAGGPSQKLTEDQAKAQTYGRLMSNAETSYQRAKNQGYNPGSVRNLFAATLEGLPFGGLDSAGAMVRDDVSDRAHQAELQWSDAQLKAVSGAASPEAEVKRGIRTFFPGTGEKASQVGEQKTQARKVAFDSVKIRSGPAGEAIGAYVKGGKEKPPGFVDTLPEPQRAAAMRFKGAVATPGTNGNPFLPSDEGEYSALPPGAFYIHPDGSVRRKGGGR